MCDCKHCGHYEAGLPKNWVCWQCPKCEEDEYRTIDGLPKKDDEFEHTVGGIETLQKVTF